VLAPQAPGFCALKKSCYAWGYVARTAVGAYADMWINLEGHLLHKESSTFPTDPCTAMLTSPDVVNTGYGWVSHRFHRAYYYYSLFIIHGCV